MAKEIAYHAAGQHGLETDPYLRPSFSRGNRLRRAVWNAVWLLLYRTSPRPLHGWRALLLRAFGATMGWGTTPAADMVAQLLIHGAEFWVHPEGVTIGNPSPAHLGGTAVRLMLIVDDPDAVFAQAVRAGAVVRSPMQDQDYGWREGSLLDPFGHRWEIGKPL